jgi:hypothetical protein
MNKKILLLLLLILVILLIIVVVIFYSIKNKGKDQDNDKDYVNKSEIVDYFNNLEYDSDGAPKGGFLISMIDMPSLCKNYNWTSSKGNMTTKENFINTATMLSDQAIKSYGDNNKNKCLTSASDCGNVLNVSDIDEWITTIIGGGGTNCYNIATTYWRRDFPQYVFGPYKGNDMVIGVLLDVTKIFDYIAGLYPMDSGTIARYNNACSGNIADGTKAFTDCCNCEKWYAPDQACYPDIISSNWITSDKNMKKQKWRKWLSTKDSTVLGMAGVGKNNIFNYESGLYGLQSADQWINVTQSDADAQLNIITNLRPEAIEAETLTRKGRGFTTGNDNRPFDKYNWATWAKAVKILYNNAEEDRLNYVDSQNLGFDGYRENEVDLIIPNKPRSCDVKTETPCQITEDFKNVFVNSIMGIISLAEDNCGNSKLNASQGPGGVGCVDNTDNCMSDPSTRKAVMGSDYANPVTCLANKENCFDRYNNAWCTKSNTVEGAKCCCSPDFAEDLVKKMVDEFNNSEIRIKAGAKKIHGYRVRCESMYSFSFRKGSQGDIDMVQIT